MRIDLTSLREGRRPADRDKSFQIPWRYVLPALFLLVGALLPMLAADQIDALMIARGWRPGEPRVAALHDWAMAVTEVEATELPLLQLDLKFRKYQRLVDKRQQALAAGKLIVSENDFVNGTIRVGRESIQVALRLQGSDIKNLRGEKWSLRVHAKRGGHVIGVERFTLRSPEADGYLRKAALYEHLRLAGVAAPRHRFVRLAINGTPVGIMSLEEYFSNELVAGQRRPEGPLLRFGKALLHASEDVAAESDDAEAGAVNLGALNNYRLAPVRVFRARRTMRDPVQRRMAAQAIALLRDFAIGGRPAEQVFDVATMARLLAVCELWGAGELLQWPNLRFYFNPLLERLEPVGYASQAEAPLLDYDLVQRDPLTRDLLASPVMRAAFVTALMAESKRVVDGGTAPIMASVALWRRQIRAEFPMARLDAIMSDRAQAFLAGHARPAVMLLARRWRVYPERLSVDAVRLANPLLVDVQVSGMRWIIPPPVDDKPAAKAVKALATRRLPAELLAGVDLPLRLTSTAADGVPSWRILRLKRPADLPERAELEIDVQVVGSDSPRKVRSERELLPSPISGAPFASGPPDWLQRSASDRGLVIPAGRWRLSRPLELPQGQGLRLEAGCELLLGPEATIVVRGPLEANGTAERPVVLRSIPGPQSGPALVVLRGGPVTLQHLHLSGADAGRAGRGLALYEVEATLKDCRFVGVGAGAAVRATRATVAFERCRFEDLRGDGVLVEYGDVQLSASQMVRVGGDGLDLAGSKARVTGCTFTDVGDKALSVGEASEAELIDLVVRRAAIGVATKDSSRTVVRNGRFEAIKLAGLAVFTKKRRYGAARLVADRVTVTGAKVPYLVQGGSELIVDGQAVAVSLIALADLGVAATQTSDR